MTSSLAGACRGGVDAVRASDRELHSRDVGVVRHATSGLAAHGMTGLMGDAAGHGNGGGSDRVTTSEDAEMMSIGDISYTSPPQPLDDDDDVARRSQMDVEDTATAATGSSRQTSASFSVVSEPPRSVSRSHMRLRSKSSR